MRGDHCERGKRTGGARLRVASSLSSLSSVLARVITVVRSTYGRTVEKRKREAGKKKEREARNSKNFGIAKGTARQASCERLTQRRARLPWGLACTATRLDSIRLALASARPVAGTLAWHVEISRGSSLYRTERDGGESYPRVLLSFARAQLTPCLA